MQRRQALKAGLATLGTLAMACSRPPPSTGFVPIRSSTLPKAPRSIRPERPVVTNSTEPPAAADPFAELRGICDGVAPVTAGELDERRTRARAALRRAGFSALISEAGSALRHLSGVRWGVSERPLLLILPVDGEPCLVAPAFEANTLGERSGAIELVLWQEHENPFATAARALGANGNGRVALDPALRLFVADGLRRQLRVETAPVLFEGLRITKTPAELERLRRANNATKAALRVASRFLERGMAEPDFADKVREAQRAAGLDNVWVLALFGPNAAFPHGTGKARTLQPGDGILVDTGGSLHGYCSDISRTWVFGDPTPNLLRAWNTVLAAQAAALERLGPGTLSGAADAAAREVLKRSGFGGGYEHFTHRLGHGIGLEVHEPPYLVPKSARALAPGMTMSVEPGIYVPGEFGVRLEDIAAITDSGVEVFGPLARSLDAPFG